METPATPTLDEASFVPTSRLPPPEQVMELASEAFRRFKSRPDRRNQQICLFGATPDPSGMCAGMNDSVHRRAQEWCDGDEGR
jgi:hypothetical protein